MGKVVTKHTTVSGFDKDDNYRSVNLAPGDELPEWAPQSVLDNPYIFEEEDSLVVAEDEETGTQVIKSEIVPEDHTSPTFAAGYEDGAAEHVEEQKAQAGDGSYENMTKAELSALLEERQLPHSGTRQDLIERLEQSDAGNS